ncbi:MAG: FHA domain-containing protein [Deltaproteobacteria bacterium]|nr:FHA domain-containing protein [Deltaproteobacteria bacterium]
MRTCPFCGTENEPFFRFWLGCGADLDEALGSGAEEPAAAAPVAERAPEPGPSSKSQPRPAPQTTRPQAPGPAAPTAPPVAAPAAPPAAKGTQVTAAAAQPRIASQRPPAPVEARPKTLDPGSVAKVATSAAAQAVAQAQVEQADRRAGALPPKEVMLTQPITPTNPLPSNMTSPVALNEVSTKRVGGGPDLAPPVSKRAAPPEVRHVAGPARARLVIILEDGTDGASLDLAGESTILGREGADLNFPHDDFLAPRHADFFFKNGQLHMKPLKSTNGVFLQVHQEVELESGDVFRIGQQLLVFESLALVNAEGPVVETKDQTMRLGSPIPEGAWGRLGQLIAPETMGSVYLLGGTEVYLGRERGDITFPGDGFVSGLHAVITHRAGRFYLKDLGSSNGTYLRLTKPMPVKRGTLVLAGQQLFRVDG